MGDPQRQPIPYPPIPQQQQVLPAQDPLQMELDFSEAPVNYAELICEKLDTIIDLLSNTKKDK
jgi:hypothetical protein